MRIAICDDDRFFLDKAYQRISCLLKKKGVNHTIEIFLTGAELITACKKNIFDAAFLDIAMPGADGFEVARLITKICPEISIVFVSSKESLVFTSYEYSPLWFVPKSRIELLEPAISKILHRLQIKGSEDKLLPIKIEKGTMIKLDLKNIAYIKSTAHYLNIHFIDQSHSSESYRNSIGKIEEQLKDCCFVRCHSRYLVNCRNISKIQSNFCILHNEERIPISRNKMAATKDCFQNYLRSMG